MMTAREIAHVERIVKQWFFTVWWQRHWEIVSPSMQKRRVSVYWGRDLWGHS